MSYLTATEWDVITAIDPAVWRSLADGAMPDPSGAIGHNIPRYLSVRFQDRASYHVILGLLAQDAVRVNLGLLAFEYAFDHQSPDGSFQIVDGASQNDAADAVAFFLAEFGRAMLLLAGSRWFSGRPELAPGRARVAALKARARPSLKWLADRSTAQRIVNASFTNRLIFGGNGQILTGLAIGNETMGDGRSFIADALESQRLDGVLPEGGGYDSSYQAVSLAHLQVLLLWLPRTRRQLIWRAVQHGVAWECSRILPSGEVSCEGNSRVYPGGETFLGVQKAVNYVDVFMSIEYSGQLSGDETLMVQADRVLNFYWG